LTIPPPLADKRLPPLLLVSIVYPFPILIASF